MSVWFIRHVDLPGKLYMIGWDIVSSHEVHRDAKGRKLELLSGSCAFWNHLTQRPQPDKIWRGITKDRSCNNFPHWHMQLIEMPILSRSHFVLTCFLITEDIRQCMSIYGTSGEQLSTMKKLQPRNMIIHPHCRRCLPRCFHHQHGQLQQSYPQDVQMKGDWPKWVPWKRRHPTALPSLEYGIWGNHTKECTYIYFCPKGSVMSAAVYGGGCLRWWGTSQYQICLVKLV